MKAKKEFEDLSKFKGRNVELFRSSDQNETAIYFTNVEYDKRSEAKAFFEVLRFEYRGGDHELYIRYPNTDYFVEIYGCGSESSRGNIKSSGGENIWEDEYKKPLSILSHKNDLLLLFGKREYTSSEFNFMTRVGWYDKGNPYNRPYPNEIFENYEEIEKALSRKYLKIPDSIRNIQYCYKTKGENPKYFLVDCPAYNFQYNNHRFFVIENSAIKEFKIKNFERYRDGGTTYITVIDYDGKEHVFFSPTRLSKKELCEKWDDEELIEVTDVEKQTLIELLDLDVLKKEK